MPSYAHRGTGRRNLFSSFTIPLPSPPSARAGLLLTVFTQALDQILVWHDVTATILADAGIELRMSSTKKPDFLTMSCNRLTAFISQADRGPCNTHCSVDYSCAN